MIVWNIIGENLDFEIEVGPITVLKGSNEYWYRLIRFVDDYFTNKNTEVQIYEDTQLLHKKDWECIFIPYDAHLQFDKINSKSPLKSLLDEVGEKISYSPIFYELLNVWEELRDELEIVTPTIEKYGLSLQMESFDIEHLKDFLLFGSTKKMMTPVDFKVMLLNLFAEKVSEKKKLIIIELPELYANDIQLEELGNSITSLSEKGIRFIIVSQKVQSENSNYIVNGKVVNEALLENIKKKVVNEVPFVCENNIYEQAKSYLVRAVDNFVSKGENLTLSTIENEAILVLLYVMINHLKVDLSVDITGVSPNLQSFVKSYSLAKI